MLMLHTPRCGSCAWGHVWLTGCLPTTGSCLTTVVGIWARGVMGRSHAVLAPVLRTTWSRGAMHLLLVRRRCPQAAAIGLAWLLCVCSQPAGVQSPRVDKKQSRVCVPRLLDAVWCAMWWGWLCHHWHCRVAGSSTSLPLWGG
jgi:hypothetical protein